MSPLEFGAGVAFAALGSLGIVRTLVHEDRLRQPGGFIAVGSALLGAGAGLIFAALH